MLLCFDHHLTWWCRATSWGGDRLQQQMVKGPAVSCIAWQLSIFLQPVPAAFGAVGPWWSSSKSVMEMQDEPKLENV